MKEAIFILLVIAALLGLTAYRYRRQIGMVLQFWRSIQDARQRLRSPINEMPNKPESQGPLVNCQKCGTWVAEDRAIRLGRSSFYCSTKCLEESATTAKR